MGWCGSVGAGGWAVGRWGGARLGLIDLEVKESRATALEDAMPNAICTLTLITSWYWIYVIS